MEYRPEHLEALAGALTAATPVTRRDPGQLAGQLLGRLLGDPAAGTMVEGIRSGLGPWLRPLSGSLGGPGGPLEYTFTGHEGMLYDVAVDGSGRLALSAGDDGTVRIWDIEAGTAVGVLRGHTDWVMAVAVTPDGRRALTGSRGRTLRLWDVERQAELLGWGPHGARIPGVAVSSDGSTAVSVSEDRTVRVWDLPSGTERFCLTGHGDAIRAVAVTPDGRLALTASWDRSVRAWDLEVGREVAAHRDHSAHAWSVAVAADGERSWSGDEEGAIRAWRPGPEASEAFGRHGGFVATLDAAADGSLLASGADDGTIAIWDTAAGDRLATLQAHEGMVKGVAITPDGSRLVSCGNDGTIKVWAWRRAAAGRDRAVHTQRVSGAAVTQDSLRAVTVSWDGGLIARDPRTGTPVATATGETPLSAVIQVSGRIITAGWDRTLTVRDPDDPSSISGTVRLPGTVLAMTSAGADRLVTGSAGGVLRTWRIRRRGLKETAAVPAHRVPIDRVEDPRSGLMTRGSLPQGVFPLGTEVVTLTPRRPRSSDADPFSGVRGVWSGFREQLEEIGREGIGQPILGVAADADGSVILTAGWDGLIKVWRGDPPRSAGSLTGHDGPVTSVVVDAGGGTAASGGSDGTVRLWDVTTSREIGRPLEGGSWVRSVDLSERWMVSGGDDHVVRLWDRRSGRQVAAFTCDARISVCTLAGDNVVAGDDAGGIHVLAIETGSGGPAGATTGSRRATSGGRSRT